MASERLKSPRIRLFVALELPEAVRAPLAEWTLETFAHPDLRPVRPESLHVTLVFLGYQRERDVERIAQAASAVPAPAFRLTPEDVAAVPRSRPRLFALGLADEQGALGAWQEGLSDRLQAAGVYEPEKRPFWPHVTLARVKRGRAPRGIAVPPPPEALNESFEATRVTLYRSTLRPQGALYEPLAALR